MKAVTAFSVIAILCITVGCQGPVSSSKKELLTVDFAEGQSLRYKFVSNRNIELDWGPTNGRKSGHKVDNFSESVTMVISYTPVEVDPYGLTTVKAACESISIDRNSATKRRVKKKDAVQNLKDKSFTLKVNPTGKIEDYSDLERLLKELGKEAFRPDGKQARIKEPDMICDIFASQWFLWNSISSIENASQGIAVGQAWKSQLSVPSPMVMKEARDVTYKLSEIRDTEQGRIAVIDSSYSLAEKAPKQWPLPYSGSFQMSGTFGFLRKYEIETLSGKGKEFFNLNTGQINTSKQEYKLKMNAALPIPVDVNPVIRIEQNLEMTLLEQ